jgi:hypothetical protein
MLVAVQTPRMMHQRTQDAIPNNSRMLHSHVCRIPDDADHWDAPQASRSNHYNTHVACILCYMAQIDNYLTHYHTTIYASTDCSYITIMPFTSPSFTTVSLGTKRNTITVQLLEFQFPKFDAPLLDKVQAFAYFEEILRQYRPQLSSVSIQLVYATNNVPVSSSAAASEEANRISCKLYSSLFHVKHLSCLGFYDSTGSKVDITTDPSKCVNDIAFVNLEATIDPVMFSPGLHTIRLS